MTSPKATKQEQEKGQDEKKNEALQISPEFPIRNHFSPFSKVDSTSKSKDVLFDDSNIPSNEIMTILIILNRPVVMVGNTSTQREIAMGTDKSLSKSLFQYLWETSTLRICADGGANRLYSATHGDYNSCSSRIESCTHASNPTETEKSTDLKAILVPDLIIGDLDSVTDEVRDYYEGLGSSIYRDSNQDINDLDKSIQAICDFKLRKGSLYEKKKSKSKEEINILEKHTDTSFSSNFLISGIDPDSKSNFDFGNNNNCNGNHHDSTSSLCYCKEQEKHHQPEKYPKLQICIYGAFGGRFDQTMASIQALHKWSSHDLLQNDEMVLITEETSARLLQPGMTHYIHVEKKVEGPSCGLIPVGQPCSNVWSEGLQWDLDGDTHTEFGGLVSTSNIILNDCVKVQCSHPLVWTTEMRGYVDSGK